MMPTGLFIRPHYCRLTRQSNWSFTARYRCSDRALFAQPIQPFQPSGLMGLQPEVSG